MVVVVLMVCRLKELNGIGADGKNDDGNENGSDRKLK